MDAELVKGTLSLLILSLLGREPMYGYQIVSTVREETGGVFEWKEGSLYPALHKLEKQQLVKSTWQPGQGRQRRKYYQLTHKGREALADKTQAWDKLASAVNTILEKGDERD